MDVILKIILILCSGLLPHYVWAEPMEIPPATTESKWPEILVLPWQTLNIDADQIAKAAKATRLSQRELAKLAIESPEVLTKSLPDAESSTYEVKGATLNQNFSDVFTGAPTRETASKFSEPLVLMPVWAALQNRQVLLLIAATSDRNTILQVAHRVVSREAWRGNITGGTLGNVFSPLLTAMWQELLTSPTLSPKPDLAIGFGNGTASLRGDEIERNVLNLIAATQHLGSFTIVNPIGSDTLTAIHRSWGQNGILRKPNRLLTMSWTYDRPPQLLSQGAGMLNLELKLKVQPSDGVFGYLLPWKVEEPVILTTTTDPEPRLQVKLSDTLRNYLELEARALQRSENPQVAKVHGAWVYLDKGRAWGLRMNDRLVIQDGTQTIKGHIVGYYGPEQKIQSSRGWPIHEGAIMFVRKGQNLTKIGQEFVYDKMTVPTAWPPAQTAAAANSSPR